MMNTPKGIDDLEAVVASAKPNATVTMPAAWVKVLLAYVRGLEVFAAESVRNSAVRTRFSDVG